MGFRARSRAAAFQGVRVQLLVLRDELRRSLPVAVKPPQRVKGKKPPAMQAAFDLALTCVYLQYPAARQVPVCAQDSVASFSVGVAMKV